MYIIEVLHKLCNQNTRNILKNRKKYPKRQNKFRKSLEWTDGSRNQAEKGIHLNESYTINNNNTNNYYEILNGCHFKQKCSDVKIITASFN